MKRHALPLFVAAYLIFGVALLLRPPANTPKFTEGKVRWNPFTQQMTLFVSSRRAIINLDEFDMENTRIVASHPDSQIIVRVTGGNPTRLKGKLPDGTLLVNPAGVYVGPESIVEPGALNILSTLDLIPEGTEGPDLPFEFLSADSIATKTEEDVLGGSNVLIGNFVDREASTVELKADGNVYALAINKEGVVRASGQRHGNRVILSAPAKPKKAEK